MFREKNEKVGVLKSERTRPKGVIEPTETIAYRERLLPCMRNAFLFRNK